MGHAMAYPLCTSTARSIPPPLCTTTPLTPHIEVAGSTLLPPQMDLYNASARAVKAVHPSLRVGGPATAVLSHLDDFVRECEQRQIPLDFVTSHHYPTDTCPRGDAWDPDCFSRDVLNARAKVPATVPFLLTEYNVGEYSYRTHARHQSQNHKPEPALTQS